MKIRTDFDNEKYLRVGTAGWSIPAPYKQLFIEDGSILERYAQLLNAVEINSSFYRHHRITTYRKWAESVPAHFRFAVKIPKTLTHNGELVPLAEVLDQFAPEVLGLGNKLEVLLVQLPPSLAFDAPVANRFFREIQKRINASVVCEPRHPSWGSEEANAVLNQCSVGRVAADPPPWPGADDVGGYRKFAYFRWHGQPRTYYSDYNRETLLHLRKQLVTASETADRVWCIFDNTALGYALGNALEMKSMKAKSVGPQ